MEGKNFRSRKGFLLMVDPDLSIENLIELGGYESKNSNIDSENFPSGRSEETELFLEFVCFDKGMTSDEVMKEIDEKGLRPATLKELLAFCATYPGIDDIKLAVALGSVWEDWTTAQSVPYMWNHNGKLGIGLEYIEVVWNKECWFAVVQK